MPPANAREEESSIEVRDVEVRDYDGPGRCFEPVSGSSS